MEDILSQLEIGGDSLNTADLESEANSAPIIRYVDLVDYVAIAAEVTAQVVELWNADGVLAAPHQTPHRSRRDEAS